MNERKKEQAKNIEEKTEVPSTLLELTIKIGSYGGSSVDNDLNYEYNIKITRGVYNELSSYN